MVSAPGKVIVFGEHAVVHGKVSLSPMYLYECRLTSIGCHRSSNFTTILPLGDCAIEIEKNGLFALPGHRPVTYMEYR